MTKDYMLTWSAQLSRSNTDSYQVFDFGEVKNGLDIIDLSSISFQAIFGMRPTEINKAVAKQMAQFSLAAANSHHPLKEKTTDELCKLIGNKGKILYTVSGAEAIENALKMAKEFTGRTKVFARRRSYHGATLGAMSVSEDSRHLVHQKIHEETFWIPSHSEDPDLRETTQLFERYGREVAALCLETITGGNGCVIAPKMWWKGIERLCKKFGVKLILDEVVTGFYRTGRPFAFHHYGLTPDFVCMAKGISAGVVPFGALWIKKDIAEFYQMRPLQCGLTNHAHPLGLAATLAVIKKLKTKTTQDGLLKRITLLNEFLKEVKKSPLVKETRSKGLMAGVELSRDLSRNQFIESGVKVYLKNKIIVLAPPLNIPLPLLRKALARLEKNLMLPKLLKKVS